MTDPLSTIVRLLAAQAARDLTRERQRKQKDTDQRPKQAMAQPDADAA